MGAADGGRRRGEQDCSGPALGTMTVRHGDEYK
jgi:hypothetical protein